MGKLIKVLVGSVCYGLAQKAVRGLSAPELEKQWERENFHQRTVSLRGGVNLAGALCTSAVITNGFSAGGLGSAAAVVGGSVFGYIDDTCEADRGIRLFTTSAQPIKAKGFKGHLGNLRKGYLTTGMLKILGIGLSSCSTAWLLRPATRSGIIGTVRDAALIAVSANFFNLLDLRPGRALKVAAIGTAALTVVDPNRNLPTLGVVARALPKDLAEEEMLGDTGANALGATFGTSCVLALSGSLRTVILGALAALTVVSERISFTQVIAETPVLREIDSWGRLR